VVESSGLLNRRRVKSSTEGSNPSLSAIFEASETSGHFYGVRFSDAVAELELADAVIVTVSFWVILPDTTRNTAIGMPCGIVATAGIHSSLVLVDSATVIPPAGATLLSVTVHQVSEFDAKLRALHLREAIAPAAGAKSVIEAVLDMPLRVAVSVAD
jgi:hypothetical protein